MSSAMTLPARILAAGTVIAGLCWSAPLAAAAAEPAWAASPQALGVRIGRDSQGVAHVFANTDAGAYYGAGYAAAEDRLFQMCWMRLVVQGRVSEFFGPGPVTNPQTGIVKKTHVISDRKARLLGWSRHADRVIARMDPEMRKLLQAYSEGVNALMQEPGLILDPMFAQHSLPLEPWTPADCVGAWLRLADFFASNGLDEALRMHEWQALLNDPSLTQQQRLHELLGSLVCDDGAAVIQEQDVPQPTKDLLASYASAHQLSLGEQCLPYDPSPHFSQAWAVDGSRSTTGRAVLIGDPRIGVTLPSQLYEWSMEGQTFAVRGVGVAGCPNILSGSTIQVAWSPTALGMDQSDLLFLHTDPQSQPGKYELDGQWLHFTNTTLETIHVQGESDVLVSFCETYWGPVVTPIVTDAQAGEEYAIRRVPFDDPFKDPSTGFLNMYRASSIDAFKDSLESWTCPSANLVFADHAGRIGYSIVGTVPVRNPKLELAGVIAQDGSKSSSDWLDVLPQALKPHVLDPLDGYVSSANNRPVGSWYPIPIRWGSGGTGDTFRSRRLRELLSNLSIQVEPKEVLMPHFDVVSVPGRDLTTIGLWLNTHGAVLSMDARRALVELAPWLQAGAQMDSSVRGVLIAWFIDPSFRLQDTGPEMEARYGGGEPGLNLFLKQSLAKINHLPPVALTAAEIAYVDNVLSAAVQASQQVGPTSVWKAWYVNNVLTVGFPKWTSLEGFPSLAPGQVVTMGPFRAVDQHTLLSPLRQSFTQFVQIGGSEMPRTVAPPGVAEPVSTHDLDQANLWLTEGLKYAPRNLAELKRLGPVNWKLL